MYMDADQGHPWLQESVLITVQVAVCMHMANATIIARLGST